MEGRQPTTCPRSPSPDRGRPEGAVTVTHAGAVDGAVRRCGVHKSGFMLQGCIRGSIRPGALDDHYAGDYGFKPKQHDLEGDEQNSKCESSQDLVSAHSVQVSRPDQAGTATRELRQLTQVLSDSRVFPRTMPTQRGQKRRTLDGETGAWQKTQIDLRRREQAGTTHIGRPVLHGPMQSPERGE